MNATDFISDKIQSLLEKFKTAKARYEYDELAKVHFIEITPQSVYDSLDFCEFEVGIYDDFIKTFPFENICLLSEDALVPLTNVLFEKEGIEYAPYTIREKYVMLPNMEIPIIYSVCNTDDSPTECVQNEPHNNEFEPTSIEMERFNNLKIAA